MKRLGVVNHAIVKQGESMQKGVVPGGVEQVRRGVWLRALRAGEVDDGGQVQRLGG